MAGEGIIDRFEAAVLRRERAATLTEKEPADFDYDTARSELLRAVVRIKHARVDA